MKILSVDSIKDYSKTIGERNKVDEIMAMVLFVQEIIGQNVLNPNWNWKTRFLKQICISLLISYVFVGTKDYLKDAIDITSIGEAYYTFFITTFFVIKYLLFVNTRGKLQILYLTAKTTLLEMVEADSLVKSKNMLNTLKLVVKMLFATTFFSVLTYLSFAIWNYIHGTRVTLSKTTTILMPMTSPYYEIGLILHTIYLSVMAFSHLVVDTWFVFLMIFFCQACDSVMNLLDVEQKKHDELEIQYAERLNSSLRMFYKNHEQLMRFFNTLRDMYKWPTIIPILCVLLGFCSILFLMSENVQWTFLSNFVPMAMELFVYNWFGEQVKDKGTQLNMALLNFDWPSLTVKDRKNYLILISYMNKELNIKTALGNDLSLITMSSVLKASYQAFALLKSMED